MNEIRIALYFIGVTIAAIIIGTTVALALFS